MFREMDIGTLGKTMLVALVYLVTVPGFFSVLVSIAAFFYFSAMLYHKIVKVHYKGSWTTFFKTTFITFFKPIIMKIKQIYFGRNGKFTYKQFWAWIGTLIVLGLLGRWIFY